VPDSIGPHLLGRRYDPDERDWTITDLERLAPPDSSLLDKTVRDVIHEGTYFSSWGGILLFWRWVKSLIPGLPKPPPPPPPPAGKTWEDLIQLDQGQTGHCVGFGWAGWGDAAPIEDTYHDPDGHAIYYAAKVIDGEAGQENGSSVRSGAKAMQARTRLAAYAFASSVGEIVRWLSTRGPVVFGTDWTRDMFSPDAQGFVHPTGPVEGGHCYVGLGYLPGEEAVLCQNSWGSNWGLSGRFKLKLPDLATLLGDHGEACVALEIT
jgi:hypothetical protein